MIMIMSIIIITIIIFIRVVRLGDDDEVNHHFMGDFSVSCRYVRKMFRGSSGVTFRFLGQKPFSPLLQDYNRE